MPKVRIVFSCVRHWVVKRNSENYGSLAQLVERHVYTVDVIGSIPVGPTDYPGTARCRGFCLPGFSLPVTRRELYLLPAARVPGGKLTKIIQPEL